MASNRRSLAITDAYGRRLKQVERRVMAEVERQWRLGPGDLEERYDEWMAAAVAAITAGQLFNVRLTIGYVTAYQSAELGRPAQPPQVNPDDFVGKTYGGGDVREWAEKPRIRAKTFIKEGVPVPDAAERARINAVMDAGLHTYAAARQSMAEAIQRSGAIGYRRRVHGETCGACLAAANNNILMATEHFASHPNCDCTAEPVYDRAGRNLNPSGAQLYRTLTPSQRIEAVGPEAANAINQGVIDLFDLEGRSVLDFAPDFLTQLPLSEAL